MNYKLIMTEGQDELAFINVLLKKNLLIFKKEELLMEQIFHKRQIDGELIGYIQGLGSKDTVDIYRVGDKLSDKLKIPHAILSHKIAHKFNICTLPEFEILFILNENYFDEFIKVKSKKSASEFYKEKNKKYRKQSNYVKQYFEEMSEKEIIDLICLYVKKHGRVHNDDQLTLKEIIKTK